MVSDKQVETLLDGICTQLEPLVKLAKKPRAKRITCCMEDIHDGNQGACIACGSMADGCEPDAREYECECCGEKKVYGLEELMIMGLLDIEDEE